MPGHFPLTVITFAHTDADKCHNTAYIVISPQFWNLQNKQEFVMEFLDTRLLFNNMSLSIGHEQLPLYLVEHTTL